MNALTNVCVQVWGKLEVSHTPHHQLLEHDEHDKVAEKAEEVHKHTHAHISRERRREGRTSAHIIAVLCNFVASNLL